MAKRRTQDAKPKCLMIPYYRVSTDRQGQSGLGLDAQRTVVETLAQRNKCKILNSFQEIETGKVTDEDRPELAKAIEHARRVGATLVVAKLDRLARNTRFLLTLIDSGVDVLFGDLPDLPQGAVGRFMLTMLSSVAELEARLISDRTKKALEAYRAGNRVSRRIREMYPDGVPQEVIEERGGKLGGALPECRNNLTNEARKKGSQTVATQAREAYAEVIPIILDMRKQGAILQAIADELNSRGLRTRLGADWSPAQVKRVIDREKRQSVPTEDGSN